MIEIRRKFRMSKGFKTVDPLDGYVFTPESNAHRFIVECVDLVDGQETVVPFEAGSTVHARFLKADHVTELVDGSLDTDGAAVVTLPAECYAVPGRFLLTILVTTGSTKICVFAGAGTVLEADSTDVNISSNTARSVDQKIAEIDNATDAAEAAVSQVNSAISAGSAKITEINQAAAAARASIPQDYTALSDSVGDLKSAINTIDRFGAKNRTPWVNGTGHTGVLTIVCNGGIYTATGNLTGSGETHYNIFSQSDALPDGISPGMKLQVVHECASSNVTFRIYNRVNGSNVLLCEILGNGTKNVTVDNNATGMIVRLSYKNGNNYTNMVSKPCIFGTLTKQETEAKLSIFEQKISTCKNLSYADSVSVSENADINNYTDPGSYSVPTGAVANTLTNLPKKVAGILYVYRINAGGVVIQKYITYDNNGESFTRSRTSGVFGEWVKDAKLTDIPNSADFHKTPIDENGNYEIIQNNFQNIAFSSQNGIYQTNIRASHVQKVNDGTVVLFDKNAYSATYMVVNAELSALLVPNTGWNTSGRMVIDAQGLNDYNVVIMLKDANNDSLNVDVINVDATTAIINRAKVVDLFMFMGQSNMAGRGITNTTWPETVPNITPTAGLEFRSITDQTRLYPMAEPFGKFENKPGGIDDGSSAPDGGNKTGSMAVAFANAYFKSTGMQIVGISASEGGTGIQYWLPNSENLNDALQRLADANTYLNNNGYVVRHRYMLWCQGESDTRLGVTKEQYKTYFMQILNTMKNAGIEKCFMFRIGEYNGTAYDYTNIIEAQTELGQNQNDVVMATTILASFKARGLMKDEYHYYQTAYNEMGTYGGTNVAQYVISQKEPTMYDPKNENLYYSHKN